MEISGFVTFNVCINRCGIAWGWNLAVQLRYLLHVLIFQHLSVALGWYSCSADSDLFLVLAPPKEASLQTPSVLCDGRLCGVCCACGQGTVTAKLGFVSAFEAFEIHFSFKIPVCRFGKAFPRGGAKHSKEENSLKRWTLHQ